MACAVTTYSLFVLRGVWMLRASPLLTARWVKIVPHVVDTILLASAIWLAISLQQYPGTHAWLSAKLLALLLYIALGSLALKRGKTLRARAIAWVAAQLVFFYIVAVALTHRALLI